MSVIVSAPGPLPEVEPRSELCDRILVAEDDPIMRTILETWLLDWGYNVVMAEDGAKAWKLLQQVKPPDLIIVDWMMPEMDGPELCRRIRSSKRERYQYVLLATSKNDRKDVVAGFDAGADDYLTKPFDKDELRARLRVARRILTLQHNLIRAQEELRFQADHDVLTGIWNRGALLQLLNREIERSARTQAATAVMMVDLDHFKKVNDTYGHLAGDAVLKETTLRMTRAVRLYDLVGRFGGEEFVLVLPDCDVDQVLTTAERIRFAIAAEPVRALGAEIPVTASIGATVASSATISATELLATADTALYQAKNAGRNRTVVL
jgi:two-component system cell cycle response regulator